MVANTVNTTPAGGTKKRRGQFLKSTIAELKKVHWPTKAEVVKYTAVVITTCIIVAIILGLLDLLFSELFGLVLG